MAKCSLRAPLPAIWHKPGAHKESVELPVGALIEEAPRHSGTLEGKVGVYWEGRHYSVSLKDLLTKAGPPRG
jgi:hypothetical protein